MLRCAALCGAVLRCAVLRCAEGSVAWVCATLELACGACSPVAAVPHACLGALPFLLTVHRPQDACSGTPQTLDCASMSIHSAIAALVRPCRKRVAAYRELAERQQRQEKLGGLAQQMSYDKQVGA